MSDEKSHLLKEAQRCRRIAQSITNAETIARMIQLAEEYEAKAAKR